MQVSDLKRQLQQKVEAELEKQLREIPATVERVVEDAVLSIIGVRRNGRNYEVDTWSKREQALHGYIQRKVEDKLNEIVGPLVDKELKRLLKLVSLRASIARQLSQNVQYIFERAFKDRVSKRFEELGTKMGSRIGDQLDSMLEDVAKFNDEICDPESFQGKIGELFLEEIAQITSQTA